MASFDGALAQHWIAQQGLELGLPLTTVLTTSSTNDLALEAARTGSRHGSTFVAEEQTRGRGRQGHAWISQPGEDLTFSVLARPSRLLPEHAPGLTLLAGLSVRHAVAAQVEAKVQLKWPNDVVCGDRKIAGILVESAVQGQEVPLAVIGVGINLFARPPPGELVPKATSIPLLGGRAVRREALLVEVLVALGSRLSVLEHAGLSALLPEFREHDALSGRPVRVGNLRGRAAGIDTRGSLLLVDEGGREHRLSSGHVDDLG